MTNVEQHKDVGEVENGQSVSGSVSGRLLETVPAEVLGAVSMNG